MYNIQCALQGSMHSAGHNIQCTICSKFYSVLYSVRPWTDQEEINRSQRHWDIRKAIRTIKQWLYKTPGVKTLHKKETFYSIIIIIIVIIIVVIIINFIFILIVYWPPLVPTLFEILWEEDNTL